MMKNIRYAWRYLADRLLHDADAFVWAFVVYVIAQDCTLAEVAAVSVWVILMSQPDNRKP